MNAIQEFGLLQKPRDASTPRIGAEVDGSDFQPTIKRLFPGGRDFTGAQRNLPANDDRVIEGLKI